MALFLYCIASLKSFQFVIFHLIFSIQLKMLFAVCYLSTVLPLLVLRIFRIHLRGKGLVSFKIECLMVWIRFIVCNLIVLCLKLMI